MIACLARFVNVLSVYVVCIHFIKPVSDLEESLSSSRSDPRREGFGRLCCPKREQCASLGNGHDRVEGLCLCPKDEVARVLASFTNED